MTGANSLTIDKTYSFGPDKLLEREGVPVEASDLVGRLDYEYRKAPASHFQRVVEAARPPVVEGGAPWAIFAEQGASRETALVVALPYCNPVIPDVMDGTVVNQAVRQGQSKAFDSNTWNNGEKHLFLFEMMKALGIRDEAGNTIPVIAVGADSQDYRPQLSADEKQRLAAYGDLSPYARNIEDVLLHTGHGRLHVAGYSQGASVSHSFLATTAPRNFDIQGAVLAELPTYKSRPIRELAVNYLLNKPVPEGGSDQHSDIKWTADGPQSRKDLETIQNRSFITMAKTIFRTNGAWRTALGLTHGTMDSDLSLMAEKRIAPPLTIGWNETSSLTHDIEEYIFSDTSPINGLLRWFKRADKLRLVKATGNEVGAPHLAGESPMYYALMIGESVLWATQQNEQDF